MKLFEHLEHQLKKEPNFVSDNGELKKWVVLNKAQELDEELFQLLLADDVLKDTFFKSVGDVTVFNQNLFMQFLEHKNYLNDSYTQYKNKVGIAIDGKFMNQRSDVALVWPYKDCILEGGQSREEDKREEIFFNEVLAQDEITQLLSPKVLTNATTYTADGEQAFSGFNRDAEINKRRGLPEETITDNLIIKGNNLLGLHTLKEEFTGRVKLIYIDPPFNTGNDSFKYNDNFNQSTWLTFMKNRLDAAKLLLKDDGLIFIHIDLIEEAYLKVLCDEIFGVDNYVNTISVRSSTPSGTKTIHKDKTIIKQKDSILVYRKTSSAIFYPQYKRKNEWDTHFNYFLDKENETVSSLLDKLKERRILNDSDTMRDFDINNDKHREFYIEHADLICQTQSHRNEELKNKSRLLKDKVLFINKDKENEVMFYNGRQLTPLSNSLNYVNYKHKKVKDFAILLCDFWDDIDFQNTQNEGGVSFPTAKKPEQLLARIIELSTVQDDIIVDFFLGSGTTAAVAHKLNRQYIGIEQLEYHENDSVNRLKNVLAGEQSGVSKLTNWQGGGSFTYLELKEYNESFINQIEVAKNTNELLSIWGEMKERSFLNYNVDIKKQDENIQSFKKLQLKDQKQHLLQILDKNKLYVNLSSLEDKDYQCTDDEKLVTRDFYKIKN